MNIVICGLDEVKKYHGKVTHILSVIDPEDESSVSTLGFPQSRRLLLTCHDVDSVALAKLREIEMPGSRCVAPTKTQVKKALSFAKRLSEKDTLLIHCRQGISRSTAIAYAILCQHQPSITEKEILRQVQKNRPQSFPNILIVKYADELLKRTGRMVKAVTGDRYNF